MKIISHRGLIDGPDPDLENNPTQVERCLGLGNDVEVDVWLVGSDTWLWYLGHDRPQYIVSESFLRREGVWCHAKNKDALFALAQGDAHHFWHQQDDYTLTSKGYIWAYPGKPIPPHHASKAIIVLPELKYPNEKEMVKSVYDTKSYQGIGVAGVCTDYVKAFARQELLNGIFL